MRRDKQRKAVLGLAYAQGNCWIVSQSGAMLAHVSDPARAARVLREAMAA
ncbi:hypothetical protein J4573_30330 [Actinomadura barringtoniae]|uniref:Uncharacterized protein n=1 Tax=Actinomadura barringtoniae TaxID=1427535 RepID=A0A939PEL4_9ACTN|nr:hypothetical protein [Actinomadura barringtoniae]MBO2451422.1 hypothetical protein [Actinomadura barringtoniae]